MTQHKSKATHAEQLAELAAQPEWKKKTFREVGGETAVSLHALDVIAQRDAEIRALRQQLDDRQDANTIAGASLAEDLLKTRVALRRERDDAIASRDCLKSELGVRRILGEWPTADTEMAVKLRLRAERDYAIAERVHYASLLRKAAGEKRSAVRNKRGAGVKGIS